MGLNQTAEAVGRPSVADSAYQVLHDQILSLDLPPGTRLSEADVAAQLGISRQPVRDAFYRLAKQGFLTIRPQVATMVSYISEKKVMQAQFIRIAIESETMREACEKLDAAGYHALESLIHGQGLAVKAHDRSRFHALDEAFHHEICARAGHAYVWNLIRENKAHLDRVRFLTLASNSEAAYTDHQCIYAALVDRDGEAAVRALKSHLARIEGLIALLRTQKPDCFADEAQDG